MGTERSQIAQIAPKWLGESAKGGLGLQQMNALPEIARSALKITMFTVFFSVRVWPKTFILLVASFRRGGALLKLIRKHFTRSHKLQSGSAEKVSRTGASPVRTSANLFRTSARDFFCTSAPELQDTFRTLP